MKAQQIHNVNEALLVLRHFIDLSAKLLPFLEELQRKDKLTVEEVCSKRKIMDVYQNYDFDTNTSKMLIDSDILDLIKESYESISRRQIGSSARKRSTAMRLFLMEHRRLKKNWFLASAN